MAFYACRRQCEFAVGQLIYIFAVGQLILSMVPKHSLTSNQGARRSHRWGVNACSPCLWWRCYPPCVLYPVSRVLIFLCCLQSVILMRLLPVTGLGSPQSTSTTPQLPLVIKSTLWTSLCSVSGALWTSLCSVSGALWTSLCSASGALWMSVCSASGALAYLHLHGLPAMHTHTNTHTHAHTNTHMHTHIHTHTTRRGSRWLWRIDFATLPLWQFGVVAGVHTYSPVHLTCSFLTLYGQCIRWPHLPKRGHSVWGLWEQPTPCSTHYIHRYVHWTVFTSSMMSKLFAHMPYYEGW